MQQLTVKQVIASTLFRICREATDKIRTKEDTKPRKYSKEQVDDIHDMLKQLGWDSKMVAVQGKIYAALLDAQELNVPAMMPLELFCVVVLDKSTSGHGYELGVPIIVTHASTRNCLHTDGVFNRWSFTSTDKPRPATDEEIKQCIEELTDEQWHTIHVNDIFKPVMDAARAQVVTVDMEPVTGKDSEEHTLPDGRKITVDA